MKRILLLLALAIAMVGCTMTNAQRCRKWRDDGEFTGTINSCVQCIETLGQSNPSSVQGCAVGLDAAKVFDLDVL